MRACHCAIPALGGSCKNCPRYEGNEWPSFVTDIKNSGMQKIETEELFELLNNELKMTKEKGA